MQRVCAVCSSALQAPRQFPIRPENAEGHQSVLHSVQQVQTVTYYYARRKPKAVIRQLRQEKLRKH